VPNFRHFAVNYFEKGMSCDKFPVFFKEKKFLEKKKKNPKKIARNHHYRLKYERVLEILYFHILNIANFD
jgi:hypothetical protein